MRLLGILMSVSFSVAAAAQQNEVARAWNQPVDPFRIAGNIYYVGASDLTSFLITTSDGHIVLDGGLEQTAPMIIANIKRLGFRIEDVRLLLNSHAHLDHAGGLAELKRATGAKFLSSAGDAPQHARGGLDDPQFGNIYPYPPIDPDRLIRDGEKIRLGDTTMTAHITAGHTKGCTTWSTTARHENEVLNVIFLCSPSIPSEYKLVGNPRYPDVIEDFRRQFAMLRKIEPDLFLASHGVFFDLQGKIKRHRAGEERAFVDPEGYRKLIERSERAFEQKVSEQTP